MELAGMELDFAVASLEGIEVARWGDALVMEGGANWRGGNVATWSPSTNWQQGGPIIERERIAVFSVDNGGKWCAEMRQHGEHWIDTSEFDCDASGPTPLIAAMRAYVASRSQGETL